MGVGVVLSDPSGLRWKSLNAPGFDAVVRIGLSDAGSIGSEKFTRKPVAVVEAGSAAIATETLRVVKLFTSLQSVVPPGVHPSACSALPVVGLVMLVLALISYFWPNLGWYPAGR